MRRYAQASAATDSLGSAPVAFRHIGTGLLSLAAILGALLTPTAAFALTPSISSTSVSAVTTDTAVLEAKVNPETEATTYHFEYGTADCSLNSCASAPQPDGNVGAGSSPVAITSELKGLQPGTTYHFRAVASNASGVAQGADRTFTTYSIPQATSACPNDVFRTGSAASLPDCRAYEMVSPIAKNGGDALASIAAAIRESMNQASSSGEKITYTTSTSFGDQESSRGTNQYMATRSLSGWTTHGLNAPFGRTPEEPFINFRGDVETQYKLFTSDLSSAWMTDNNKFPLSALAPEGLPNLYRTDSVGSYEPFITTAPSSRSTEVEAYFPEVLAHSADFSHIVFSLAGAITPDAAPSKEEQLYDYSGGELHLVSVLPDGAAATQRSAAGTTYDFIAITDHNGMVSHAMSDDGSRVFFTVGANPGPGKLYVRENPAEPQSAVNGSEECTEPPKACTRLVSADTSSNFWSASSDGSAVVYTTGSSFTTEEGSNSLLVLNRFDVDTKTATKVAGEVGGVVGSSDDASYVYFTSQEVLAAGATSGEWNLYLDHEGTKTFIATLSQEDRSGKKEQNFHHSAGGIDSNRSLTHVSRVTPDGRSLVFMSNRSLTGYDNADAATGEPDAEVYRFDADAGHLSCVSCNPAGVKPAGQELKSAYTVEASFWGVPAERPEIRAAAWLQSWIHNTYVSRALTDDGNRLFFNSFDALVPGDTNGTQDVYQWQAPGSGSCTVGSPGFSARNDGCINLISTGKSAQKSEFIDATPDGSSVFFETSSSIDPRDPGLIDIYVARTGGGFPLPPNSPECQGDACQSVPAAPSDPTPASASFNGPGNVKPQRAARRCRARKHRGGKHERRGSHQKGCRHSGRRAGR